MRPDFSSVVSRLSLFHANKGSCQVVSLTVSCISSSARVRDWMLYRLQRHWQVKVIAAAIALYTLCFAAPTASLAFGRAAAAHCLVVGHDDMASAHGLGGLGAATPTDRHQAPSHDDDHRGLADHADSCCGLFCVGAIPDAAAQVSAAAVGSEPIVGDVAVRLVSRSPDHLYRPPIAFS